MQNLHRLPVCRVAAGLRGSPVRHWQALLHQAKSPLEGMESNRRLPHAVAPSKESSGRDGKQSEAPTMGKPPSLDAAPLGDAPKRYPSPTPTSCQRTEFKLRTTQTRKLHPMSGTTRLLKMRRVAAQWIYPRHPELCACHLRARSHRSMKNAAAALTATRPTTERDPSTWGEDGKMASVDVRRRDASGISSQIAGWPTAKTPPSRLPTPQSFDREQRCQERSTDCM